MEFIEYPKRIDDDKVVNSREEEIKYLKIKGVIVSGDLCTFGHNEDLFELSNEVTSNDKKDETGVSSEIGKGEESQQAEPIKEEGEGQTCGSPYVQENGDTQWKESPVGILKRKPGRPPYKKV